MAMLDDFDLHDRLQSAHAQIHHVQTRILQSAINGRMTPNVAAECAKMLTDAADTLGRAAK